MPDARDQHHRRIGPRAFESLQVGRCYQRVGVAVHQKDGRAHARELRRIVEPVADQRARHDGHRLCHDIGQAGQARHQHQRRDIVPQRDFGCRARPDRIADHDDLRRIDARRRQPAHRRRAIAIEACFAGRAGVAAIAAIFDEHQPVPRRRGSAHRLKRARQIVAIAVEEEDRRLAFVRRAIKSRQTQAVVGLRADDPEPRRRRGRIIGGRGKDHPPLLRIEQRRRNNQQHGGENDQIGRKFHALGQVQGIANMLRSVARCGDAGVDRNGGGKRRVGEGALRLQFAQLRQRRQFAARPPRCGLDPRLDDFGRAGQRDEIDAAARGLDQRDHALRKIGRDARLGVEGEDQRPPLGGGGAKHVDPHRLAQFDKGRAAERKHREQCVDDEVIVEQRQSSKRRQLARDGQLSRRRGTMDDDQLHPSHARNSISVRSRASSLDGS